MLKSVCMDKTHAFPQVGHRDGVDIFHNDESESIELVAVGEIDAPPLDVHNRMLSFVDPRVIASIAESWCTAVPLQRLEANTADFSVRAHWNTEDIVRVGFHMVDMRGAITRTRNWVSEINGSWRLEPIEGGAATRALLHLTIEVASRLPQWTVRAGATRDLPALFELVRSLTRRAPTEINVAASSAR